MDQIHLDPARVRLIRVGEGESILDYPWSSLPMGDAVSPRKRAPWLAATEGLEVFGFADTTARKAKW